MIILILSLEWRWHSLWVMTSSLLLLMNVDEYLYCCIFYPNAGLCCILMLAKHRGRAGSINWRVRTCFSVLLIKVSLCIGYFLPSSVFSFTKRRQWCYLVCKVPLLFIKLIVMSPSIYVAGESPIHDLLIRWSLKKFLEYNVWVLLNWKEEA